MTVAEADSYLKTKNVNPLIYNVGSPTLAECYVLEKIDDDWVTYMWERGRKASLQKFHNKEVAVDFFIRRVISIASDSIEGFIV